MHRVAWLGLYDHPAQYSANNVFWAALAARLRAAGLDGVPNALSRDLDAESAWSHPGLLFGQIGVRQLQERYVDLRAIGAPVYDHSLRPGYHGAFIMVARGSPLQRLSDLVGVRAAIDERESYTGVTLFEQAAGPLDAWAAKVVVTGSDRASLDAIVYGRAEAAAIDEIAFDVVRRYEPDFAARFRILAATLEAPVPPFVTTGATNDRLVRLLSDSLSAVITSPETAGVVRALGFHAILTDVGAYRVASHEDRACASSSLSLSATLTRRVLNLAHIRSRSC